MKVPSIQKLVKNEYTLEQWQAGLRFHSLRTLKATDKEMRKRILQQKRDAYVEYVKATLVK